MFLLGGQAIKSNTFFRCREHWWSKSMSERTLKEQISNIRGEINKSAQELGVDFAELSYEEAAKKRVQLMTKFAGSDQWRFPWEHLIHSNIATYRDVDGTAYQLISDFIKNSRTLMIFNEEDERAGFEFKDGTQVIPVLDECLSFEFYLTNKNLDYFICFNHHDYLITAGTAASWLKDLLDENHELKKPIKEIVPV
jgi:hypothetical protein